MRRPLTVGHGPHRVVIYLIWFLFSTPLLAEEAGVMKGKADLHVLPSNGSKVAHTLAARTPVDVLRRTGLWFEVRANDDAKVKGWVRFSKIHMTGGSKPVQAQTQSSGVVSNLARSATGLFGYGAREQPAGSKSISTIGIRGLSAAELTAAKPDLMQLQRMEKHRASAQAARRYASAGSLTSQKVAYLGSGKSGLLDGLLSGQSKSKGDSNKKSNSFGRKD